MNAAIAGQATVTARDRSAIRRRPRRARRAVGPLTTLRVGPVAQRFITCTSTDQGGGRLERTAGEGIDPLVLGGGSNSVLADTMTNLTVVRLLNARNSVDGNICSS